MALFDDTAAASQFRRLHPATRFDSDARLAVELAQESAWAHFAAEIAVDHLTLALLSRSETTVGQIFALRGMDISGGYAAVADAIEPANEHFTQDPLKAGRAPANSHRHLAPPRPACWNLGTSREHLTGQDRLCPQVLGEAGEDAVDEGVGVLG